MTLFLSALSSPLWRSIFFHSIACVCLHFRAPRTAILKEACAHHLQGRLLTFCCSWLAELCCFPNVVSDYAPSTVSNIVILPSFSNSAVLVLPCLPLAVASCITDVRFRPLRKTVFMLFQFPLITQETVKTSRLLKLR